MEAPRGEQADATDDRRLPAPKKAKVMRLASEGAVVERSFTNCDKVLLRLHQLM